MPNVLVYNFKAYDIQKGAVVHANRMDTRAGNRAVGGTPIEGTGVEIDDAVLDGSDVWELTAIDFQPPSARKEN